MSNILFHIHRHYGIYTIAGLVLVISRLLVLIFIDDDLLLDTIMLIPITLLFYAFLRHPHYSSPQDHIDRRVKILYIIIVVFNIIDFIFNLFQLIF